jgi:hypothetical protein
MRVARHADDQAASSAAIIKTAVLASKVGGSLTPTSYRRRSARSHVRFPQRVMGFQLLAQLGVESPVLDAGLQASQPAHGRFRGLP